MTEKILEYLKLAREKLGQLRVSHDALRYVLLYALLIVLGCLLYLTGWCATWYATGKPDVAELRQFLHEIASAPWIAVIGFIARAMVDKDGDGIPDELEKEETTNGRSTVSATNRTGSD